MRPQADENPPAQIVPLALPTEQAAVLCGLTTTHFRRLVNSGRGPQPSRLGRKWLFPVAALRAWVDGGFRAPRPAQADRARRESCEALDRLAARA